MADKFIAPDGGWGWVIVFTYAFNNIIIIPTLQGFALLYRDVFTELGLSGTDTSIIINLNAAFGLMLGLFVGPLLKLCGYRKVAMGGSLLIFIGFALCSTSQSFMDFIIYYGIINSSGFSTTLAAYSLALNTYFNIKRNRASGLCTALTGLGPVIMPFVMSCLMSVYGVRGTALILSALILHSFAGALLLQPVKWHARKDLDAENEKELEVLNTPEKGSKPVIEIVATDQEEDGTSDEAVDNVDCKSVYGAENHVIIPTKNTMENGGGGLYLSTLSLNEKTLKADPTWWRRESNSARRPSLLIKCDRKKSKSKKCLTKIVQLFDLDLLKDAGYRNIWLGMSLAFTGEINFSMMTPLILGDKGMSIDQTAQLMSAIAFTDIIFRFISPFIGEWLKLSPKHMYMGSLVCLVATRSSLTYVEGYSQMLIACLVIGVAKGLRTVYMALVIPSSVPLEKLASASGLQTLLNGVLLVIVGPLLGYLRDHVGNYDICIHVINSFSTVTIILWSIELLITLRKSKSNNVAS